MNTVGYKDISGHLIKYWSWFQGMDPFYGTLYDGDPSSRILVHDRKYEIITREELEEAIEQVDIWKDSYKAGIWDCDNFAMRMKSSILHYFYEVKEKTKQPAIAAASGRIKKYPHAINLAIIKENGENVVKLIEPQLSQKIWEPNMIPLDLQEHIHILYYEVPRGESFNYADGIIYTFRNAFGFKWCNKNGGCAWWIAPFDNYSLLRWNVCKDLRDYWERIYNFTIPPENECEGEDRIYFLSF